MDSQDPRSPALEVPVDEVESDHSASYPEGRLQRTAQAAVFQDSPISTQNARSTRSMNSRRRPSTEATSIPALVNHAQVANQAVFQGSIVHGNIYFHGPYQPASFFAPLNLTFLSFDDDELSRRSRRVNYQAGRQLPDQSIRRLASTQGPYVPHAAVNNRRVRQRLFKIAECFSFIDRGFAEYFKVVLKTCPLPYLANLLQTTRETIVQRQSGDVNYLGDLGEYCQRLNEVWQRQQGDTSDVHFTFTHTRDQVFGYLQDAYEVHYWSFMADLFLEERANSRNRNQSMEVVLRVLDSLRHELRQQLARLAELRSHDVPEPIQDGIDARMHLLDAILESASMEDPMEFESLITSRVVTPNTELAPAPMPAATAIQPASQAADQKTELENVSLMTLFFVFLALAIVPGSIAFSKSINIEPPEDGVGSTSDDGFWWLVEGTLLAVLGNLLSAVPLLKTTRRSAAYTVMWAFMFFSMAFGIVSVAIYPFNNGAWSSLCGFFCNFFAIGSVLVLTQAVGSKLDVPPTASEKAKKE